MGTACSVALPILDTAGPQILALQSPQRARYLVYRPFFRQKEFLTESRRLLSSRAGKLLSSKLIISPWPRALDLTLFPGGVIDISHSLHPFRPGGLPSPTPPFSLPGWAAPSFSC